MPGGPHPVLTARYRSGWQPLSAALCFNPYDIMAHAVPLPATFFTCPALDLAPALLGCLLVHETPAGSIGGLIVETEAYRQHDDPGCHAYRGETPRNRALFLSGGHTYVYLIYGMYHCLNVSAGEAGVGTGVLIRALEPLIGLPQLMANRGSARLRDLTRGPGRLAQGLAINRSHGEIPVYDVSAPIRVLGLPGGWEQPFPVATSTRINVHVPPSNTYEWRFFVPQNPFVS